MHCMKQFFKGIKLQVFDTQSCIHICHHSQARRWFFFKELHSDLMSVSDTDITMLFLLFLLLGFGFCDTLLSFTILEDLGDFATFYLFFPMLKWFGMGPLIAYSWGLNNFSRQSFCSCVAYISIGLNLSKHLNRLRASSMLHKNVV